MSSSFIGIRNVHKSYGLVRAVDGVDIDIPKSAFFSLLGPSGCGKTTLLNILGGLTLPTSGTILIDGVDVTKQPPYKRPTNMVFQSYAIFPHLSVADNIGYGLRGLRLDSKERSNKINAMLELIQLPKLSDRMPNELSGGQLQRIALARALIMSPKVLLLDEPLSALDKRLRQNMQIELRALQREVGITFVFVTHDQEEALTLSDLVAVMSNGKVLQCSTPSDLYEHPNSLEVAEFVGEMNILKGKVYASEKNRIIVDVPIFGKLVFNRCSDTIEAGRQVVVGIRPEQFEVMNGQNAKRLKIVNQAYFGNVVHLLVKGEGVEQPLVIAQRPGDYLIPKNADANLISIFPNTDKAVLLPVG